MRSKPDARASHHISPLRVACALQIGQRMTFRRLRNRRGAALSAWRSLLLPAVVLGLATMWARSSRADLKMPRLPVRRTPPAPRQASTPRADRLRRLQAHAPEVVLPMAFWDAEEELDDPAEIPSDGLSFVSEASQSAARRDPAELEEEGLVLHW